MHAQSDVWACFDEASLFGREFYTLGGSRGPSLAYYVPSLSALHLLLPHRPERAHSQPASLYRLSDAAAQQVRTGCRVCKGLCVVLPCMPFNSDCSLEPCILCHASTEVERDSSAMQHLSAGLAFLEPFGDELASGTACSVLGLLSQQLHHLCVVALVRAAPGVAAPDQATDGAV